MAWTNEVLQGEVPGKDRKATRAGTDEVLGGKERCRQGLESYRGLDQ